MFNPIRDIINWYNPLRSVHDATTKKKIGYSLGGVMITQEDHEPKDIAGALYRIFIGAHTTMRAWISDDGIALEWGASGAYRNRAWLTSGSGAKFPSSMSARAVFGHPEFDRYLGPFFVYIQTAAAEERGHKAYVSERAAKARAEGADATN